MHYELGFYVAVAIAVVLLLAFLTAWSGWGDTNKALGDALDLLDEVEAGLSDELFDGPAGQHRKA